MRCQWSSALPLSWQALLTSAPLAMFFLLWRLLVGWLVSVNLDGRGQRSLNWNLSEKVAGSCSGAVGLRLLLSCWQSEPCSVCATLHFGGSQEPQSLMWKWRRHRDTAWCQDTHRGDATVGTEHSSNWKGLDAMKEMNSDDINQFLKIKTERSCCETRCPWPQRLQIGYRRKAQSVALLAGFWRRETVDYRYNRLR